MTDIGPPVATSVSDVNSSPELKHLYPDPSQCIIKGASPEDLGNDLAEFLRIEDGHKLELKSTFPLSSGKKENTTLENEDECEERHQTESTCLTSEEFLSEGATLACGGGKGGKAPLDVAVDGEDEEVEDEKEKDDLVSAVWNQNGCEYVKPAHPQPLSLPTPLKPVSAMKGSREKQGMPPKRLNVKWAPDVYDPPPSPSPTVGFIKPRPKTESKKNGKNKRKGKSSKGISSKDKKQVRKHGGSSNKFYQSLDYYNKVVEFNDPFAKLGDFDDGSPDSYCGSSFLKKSVTRVHLSIAEAT
ncbi:hypothetical protein RHMOL_Rhmol04G0256600 [Rhododendron molle]|uniref:Uncharacterized protein n=1 Tax=Rhododendron molle TaxID=49168 RepID=A0ACC0P604_RHOML|nr:hypothetical protein RHMOL_Rhmol04G0256600 [Rhododendron molle]